MHLDKNIQRRLIASILFGVFVFFGLALFGDVKSVIGSLRSFNWWMLPVIVGLAFCNYILRFIRWAFYLRMLDIQLPLRDSVTVFMSGLAMSISPGKLGELIKTYFLKQMTGTPMRKSVPVVFAERFTDFLSIVTLAALGAFSFEHGQKIIWVGAAGTLVTLIILMNRRLGVPMIRLLSRLPLLHRPGETILNLYENAYTLLRVRPLVTASLLGMFSWFCECVGFYLTIGALGFSIELWPATFIYAFSTFFGAITMLPGGLGTTEGSLTGLAILHGLPKDAASAATIVIRIATLWFAVGLGLAWLAPNRDALIPDKDSMRDYAGR